MSLKRRERKKDAKENYEENQFLSFFHNFSIAIILSFLYHCKLLFNSFAVQKLALFFLFTYFQPSRFHLEYDHYEKSYLTTVTLEMANNVALGQQSCATWLCRFCISQVAEQKRQKQQQSHMPYILRVWGEKKKSTHQNKVQQKNFSRYISDMLINHDIELGKNHKMNF